MKEGFLLQTEKSADEGFTALPEEQTWQLLQLRRTNQI
jgi:hypothetical protein